MIGPSLVGQSLGPYRIDRELGAGGMGTVYAATAGDAARAVAPGVTVALKVVHPHLVETPGFFKRFMREAQIGQTVRHPNVVRTLDCDSVVVGDQRHDYLAMEYVEGQTLRDLLVEMDRVPEELCRHIGREVSKGLAAIHDAGVVHRDLKPENVLITADHVIKVMDLGVARLMDEAVRLSQTGAFVGSLHYAAPEQFDGGGEDLDGRADLHALGLVLYELSTGQHPFLADSVPEIVNHVLRTEPRKVGQIHPQISAFFEEAVHCLLAKDRAARFSSATALFATLDAGEESAWWKARARSLQAETKRPIRRIRIPRETAVYGREREIAQLTTLYESAASGDGQVVLIEGEAGIGKSRLVDELIARLQSSGEDLNVLFGSYPPGGAASASGAFSTAFREQFGAASAEPYLPQTPRLVPAFQAVLTGDAAPEGVDRLTKDSLATCFVQAARVLATERPTVILIDDLHFAPEAARGLFCSLAMALPGHRVLLIGTTRPGAEGEWRSNLRRFEHVTQMQVERLFPKDLMALLRDSFKSEELASSLAGQIATKSDGNPFFAFEIIRGLREGQFITQRDDGTWASTQIIDEIKIPSAVLDLVNARVADLTEEERDLLDVACCWGYEFDPGLIGDVLGLRRIPLLKRFGQIERAHRLVRASGRNYVFDHHQVQEALYGSLHAQMREVYHAALADALEARTEAGETEPEDLNGALCVDLCEHYLEGARGEAALRYLRPAQTHLEKGYLHAQAIAIGERALAVPGLLSGAERARMLLRVAAALDALGHRERQEECAQEAARLAEEVGDDRLRENAEGELGRLFINTARHQEGQTALERAADLARARGDARAEAATLANLGQCYYSQGRLREAKDCAERALARCDEIGERAARDSATINLGNVFFSQGQFDAAEEQYQRAIELSREFGRLGAEAMATGNLGNVCFAQGRYTEATGLQERSLALHREMGNRQGAAVATGNLGSVLRGRGRVGAARRYHERHLELSREIGYRLGEAYAHANLADVAENQDETAACDLHYEECLSISDELGLHQFRTLCLWQLGRRRAEEGDHAAARELLVSARDLAREFGFAADEVSACCHLALLRGGDARDALTAYAEHQARLTRSEHYLAEWWLWRATGERARLAHARQMLDEQLAEATEEDREAMVQNVRVNREILAAWREEFGEDDDATGHGPCTESPTRAG